MTKQLCDICGREVTPKYVNSGRSLEGQVEFKGHMTKVHVGIGSFDEHHNRRGEYCRPCAIALAAKFVAELR